jgi:type II secretory pathway predicted ATPase ExeA
MKLAHEAIKTQIAAQERLAELVGEKATGKTYHCQKCLKTSTKNAYRSELIKRRYLCPGPQRFR